LVAWAGALIVGGAWLGRTNSSQQAANDPQFEIKSAQKQG
jgi:hypothetical protein